jgi:hypothetical protein
MPGCWEVTGTAGDRELKFVTKVSSDADEQRAGAVAPAVRASLSPRRAAQRETFDGDAHQCDFNLFLDI